jgi:catechol 2,3-dioxygenase-like lactoylglutathione lyase family enzyme
VKFSLPDELGDRLFTIAALGLALVSAGFGSLMVVRLERMGNQPVPIGTDLAGTAADEVAAADSIVTGTIGRVGPALPAGAIGRHRRQGPQALGFRLLSVVDGVAFVEVMGPDGNELWPVDIGATLPGAGQVTSISRDDNRWHVRTSVMTISGELQ